MQKYQPVALSWGLLIATKDRPNELGACIRLALEQTRPPVEVIVVDASAAWADHARLIGAIVGEHPGVRFAYLPAEVPSLTVQRNQAIVEATADIVFMIDDDSFMYPDCADEILRVYEADAKGEVVGIQATTASMPDKLTFEAPQKQKGEARSGGIARWLWRKVFLMNVEEGFIPYDKSYPDRPVPSSLTGLPVTGVRLLGGFRMTYRRAVIAKVRFDPVLRFYCPFEDLDASYRVSREGGLLTAHRARLHHYTAASGRIDRRKVAQLSALNQAILLQRHASDQAWAQRAYRRLMVRRIIAESCKDLLAARLSFPQLRGTLRALTAAAHVFRMTDAEIEDQYPEMQAEIVRSRGISH